MLLDHWCKSVTVAMQTNTCAGITASTAWPERSDYLQTFSKLTNLYTVMLVAWIGVMGSSVEGSPLADTSVAAREMPSNMLLSRLVLQSMI